MDATGEQRMNYEDAVTEARRLVKRSESDQWRLAELTWGQVRTGTSKAQWARDIGTSERTVHRWYHIWEQWKGTAAADLPEFSEAQSGVEPDYEEKRIERGVRRLPPERKAEIVHAALDDDRVQEAVMGRLESLVRQRSDRDAHISSEFEQHWGHASREVDEERAAYLWMTRLSSLLRESHRYQPEDVFSHASKSDIGTWDQNLRDGLPLLRTLAEVIKARLGGQLEVAR